MRGRRVEIVGAGPAGLSAALAAHAQGAAVQVYEKRPDIGARFHGDFQGLENWTSNTDVLAELEQLGIRTSFTHIPVYEIVIFDSMGQPYTARAADPLLYLVRRGSTPGTLDRALEIQARDAGITIHLSERRRRIKDGGVVAEGPHRADVIASGYVFETDMADACYGAISDQLAPQGYSYLLVSQGRGTVATCLFDEFHDERRFLENTVNFFQQAAGLRWQSAKRFGGSGNYHDVKTAVNRNRLYVGESAGFQDALFGFGLRYALISGYLAGSTYGSAKAYEGAWRTRLSGLNTASIFNRWFYSKLGDQGRRVILQRVLRSRDARQLLHDIYRPTVWKTLVARCLPTQKFPRTVKPPDGCDCTWCRCYRDDRTDAERAA